MADEEEDRQKPLTLDEILKQEKFKPRRGKISVPISVGRGFGNRVKKMTSDYEDEDDD
jgi:hypothetical protein